jgi:segregation and condensation protein B
VTDQTTQPPPQAGELNIEDLSLQIEAILFCSPQPISFQKLKNAFAKFSEEEIKAAVEKLKKKYSQGQYSFEIAQYEDDKYCFVTKQEYSQVIKNFFNIQENIKLNRSVLETLAIIAYKGPITKSEIDIIRGINSAGALDSLLEKELIKIVGKKDTPGKPLLYAVSEKFMQLVGIKNISELPPLQT